MQKFIRVKAVAAPLPLANVDTDMIIPAQYMKALTRSGLGRHLFRELRFDEDGRERADFILNRPACRDAQIMVADRNFENRQGRGGRTHLMSPALAAASAVAGCIASPDMLD